MEAQTELRRQEQGRSRGQAEDGRVLEVRAEGQAKRFGDQAQRATTGWKAAGRRWWKTPLDSEEQGG